ncbi:MAG TPA: hypothetical protein VJ842_14430 [Pyrinomonadaceae bacterium]|nr:hypothetical protein [Pyrinomonadaceae bacterium]
MTARATTLSRADHGSFTTGCVIQEAIEFHLEGLRLEGFDVPEPSSYSSYVEVAA